MKSASRRRFLTRLAAGLPLVNTFSPSIIFAQKRNMFIHHVYFWLNDPSSSEDRRKLIDGLKKLAKVSTIRNYYIGQPAASRREVVDSSYDISWLLFFENAYDQDKYQSDPIHLKFVEECSSLWKKVIVYDTVDV